MRPSRSLTTATLALALITAVGCGDDGSTSSSAPGGGEPLERLDGGGPIALFEASDTPRVVNLWATWCVPCRRELPAFDEVAAAAGDEVEIVGVNVGDSTDDARALVEELDLAFPQLHDPSSTLSAELDVVSMPTTAFVDADGEVVEVHAGAFTADELVAAIDDELGVDVDLP